MSKKKINSKQRITVIGGGTGTSVVLSGLKANRDIKLNAIVVVSDSGGSTGRLRDEFGFLAVGDLRQCLAALADGKNENEIRNLLLYRFNKGSGLKGHNLGNLILTALEDMHKSPGKAIELASKIFRVKGSVYPSTEKSIQLVTEYQDGSILEEEKGLDDHQNGGKKIKSISLKPTAKMYEKAKKSIINADMIVLGPGDLYGSLLPNTLVGGFKKTLVESSAKFVYIVNLMTHYSQTHEMTANDHISEVIKYCGRKPDVVVINTGKIPTKILEAYANQQEYPVVDDLPKTTKYTIIRDDFISKKTAIQDAHDQVIRSYLRHDEKKLAKYLIKLL